eukprot:TRINITY_DN17134_c0_g1_i1.p1 TRINITY_DN17134_c0_g1~~TRINITY_DN17134_c0_g1_i1.p1  ORF type:complete len:944 (-),score=147.40 TRINITY_DN17134_c0_g1_i1:1562-4393(-)
MAQSVQTSWGGHNHKSQSTEQLDKLLAGLDELSGNLPDLNSVGTKAISPSRKFPTWNASNIPAQNHNNTQSGSNLQVQGRQSVDRDDYPSPVREVSTRVATMPPAHNLRPRTGDSSISNTNGVTKTERSSGNLRTYEDDLDYVLEKDMDQGIKGTEKKVVVGVENYGEIYSEKNTMEEPTPYHTRYDSKPFSYIRQNPSVPTSKNVSRCSSREALDGGRGRGLESPSLLRKVIGVAQAEVDSPPASPAFNSPGPASRNNSFSFNQRQPTFAASSAHNDIASSFANSSFSEANSRGNNTSTEVNVSFNNNSNSSGYNNISNGVSSYNNSTFLSALNNTSSVLENSFSEINDSISKNSDTGSAKLSSDNRSEEDRQTWLQKQQRKLQERREVQKKTQQESAYLIKELKTSLQRARSGGTETTDGYASDVNSLLYSETSRESSPAKQIYNVPLRVETETSANNLTTSFQNESSNNIYSSVNKRSQTPTLSAQKAQEMKQMLSRQRSDSSYDRHRPLVQKKRHDSESEAELTSDYHFRNGTPIRSNGHQNGSCNSIDSAGALGGYLSSAPGSRPITPAFPQIPSTPYFNQSSNTLPPKSPSMFQSRGGSRMDLTARAPSPAGSVYQADMSLTASRRGSLSSEPSDVAATNVKLVKDNHKYWYKQSITREEAIALLRNQQPGTFIVRDSNSFPGAYGLALKVATPPQNSTNKMNGDPKDIHSELVRHFLIEPTSKGVKLKGYSNEPVFASLSALIYQHTITALALPIRLVLPQNDLGGETSSESSANAQMQQLLQLGAACNVHYLFTMETDQLTGPQAVRKTVSQLFLTRPLPVPTVVHFKVSGQGITLTDQARKLFFRKHYNVSQISHCGVDPEDRRWSMKNNDGLPSASNKLFAFVARKPANRACNQCHVFAELDADQPARAIVNFVNKLMLSGNTTSTGRSADMV